MVVMNDMDRFHLVMDVIDRVPGLAERAGQLRQRMADTLARHHAWTREHGEDLPEVTNWTWAAVDGMTPMTLVVVNAGSSSLKVTRARRVTTSWRTRSTSIPGTAARTIRELADFLATAGAGAAVVGHRVVHGGTRFSQAVLIDDGVLDGDRRS